MSKAKRLFFLILIFFSISVVSGKATPYIVANPDYGPALGGKCDAGISFSLYGDEDHKVLSVVVQFDGQVVYSADEINQIDYPAKGSPSISQRVPQIEYDTTHTFVVSATFGGGISRSKSHSFICVRPILNIDYQTVSVNEGQTASNSGVYRIRNDGPVTVTATVGDIVASGGVWSWTYPTTDGKQQSGNIYITSRNAKGAKIKTKSFSLEVKNVAPIAHFDAPMEMTAPGVVGVLEFTQQFDPGFDDILAGFTYSYDCDGNGEFDAQNVTDAVFPCSDLEPGTYEAVGQIKDKDGDSNEYMISLMVANPKRPNQPPVAVDDYFTTPVDIPFTITDAAVLANDSDPDGDPIKVIDFNPDNPACGTLVDNPDGSHTFTPNPGATCVLVGTYTISDTDDAQSTANVTLAIGGEIPNLPPIAVDDNFTSPSGTPITIAAADVLANDSDPNGDLLTVVDFVPIVPACGTAAFNPDNSFTFTATQEGECTLVGQYTISDPQGERASANVTLTIIATALPPAAVNHAPIAVDDGFTTSKNTPITITVEQVLSNDSDPDGDELHVVVIGEMSSEAGTVTLNGDSYTFTPKSGFSGPVSGTYTISDGQETATATVTITVK